MTTCPCCSNSMLRHIRQNQVYWFCRHCWQEMPVLERSTFQMPSSPLVLNSIPASLKRALVAV